MSPEIKPEIETGNVLKSVYDKARTWKESGKPYPPWLQTQINAVHLMAKNFDRGLVMLLDGLQEEKQYLEQIEAEHGGPSEE